MLTQQIVDRITQLNIKEFVQGLNEQLNRPNDFRDMSFEERLSLLIDREYLFRFNKVLNRKIKEAELRFPLAALEDLNYKADRCIDKNQIVALGECNWIKENKSVIITGATGSGKSYLSCALAVRACLNGFSCKYYRTTNLLNEMQSQRVKNTQKNFLRKLKKYSLILIDDFAHTIMSEDEEKDILEIVEERYGRGAIIITSQMPTEKWHAAMPNPTLADAILDRLVPKAERIKLQGGTLR